MKRWLERLVRENDAVLSFEWVLLVTLLTIGIVSGLTAARDAIIDELGDVAEAAQAFDQSYSLSDFDIVIGGTTIFQNNPSVYNEGPEDAVVVDCTRVAPGGPDQGTVEDLDS
jgi:Flp pilus assembly pilin Flp